MPDLTDRPDLPDLYGDGFSLTAGPFGVTLTILRSEPTGEAGAHPDPSSVVGRVRFSREMARVFADQLSQILVVSGQSPTSSTVKH